MKLKVRIFSNCPSILKWIKIELRVRADLVFRGQVAKAIAVRVIQRLFVLFHYLKTRIMLRRIVKLYPR